MRQFLFFFCLNDNGPSMPRFKVKFIFNFASAIEAMRSN